ncbi:MAG TPA: UDP-N-acetylmuramate--L-alanine ligase, partial [Paludibacteraceae bacterium]|nr:UDP-N-acetylmuramate--L-alanine ligase [Paludibacteraceae bacterium]
YPARELPIEGITSEKIFQEVKLKNKILCTKEDLLPLLKEKDIDVLVTFGAGDIDKLVPEIKKQLKESNR